MDEEGIEVQEMFDPSTMAAMLRIALNNLVQDVDPEQAIAQQGDDEEVESNQDHSYQKISKRGKTRFR